MVAEDVGGKILFALLDKIALETMRNGGYLRKLAEIEEEQMTAIQGHTYSNRFTIPAGHQVVKVDLSDSQSFSDTHPTGVSFYVPGHPVASFYIYNEGPTTDLLYSFNTQNNQSVANSLLKPGEDRQITLPRRLIKVLNFVGDGGAVTVRFEAIA